MMGIEGVDDGPGMAGRAAVSHFHGAAACSGGPGCSADHLTGAAREAVIPVTPAGRMRHLEMQASVLVGNLRAFTMQLGMLARDMEKENK